ncbi:MAG: hypothetical protein AAF733_01385 [Verrucomicrobiota bacterium]
MRLIAALLVLFFLGTDYVVAQQYGDIEPRLKCHYSRKDRSFCKMFPQFSLRHNICNPAPQVVGNIEWCREDITVTERSECGDFDTYDAVVVTYRPVYCNGAWGKKFKRTYRKEAALIVPPLAKNVIK